MKQDILEILRKGAHSDALDNETMKEAADHIEVLRSRLLDAVLYIEVREKRFLGWVRETRKLIGK